jgi:hypothetical protein
MVRMNGKPYGRMELILPNVFTDTVSGVLFAVGFMDGYGIVNVC